MDGSLVRMRMAAIQLYGRVTLPPQPLSTPRQMPFNGKVKFYSGMKNGWRSEGHFFNSCFTRNSAMSFLSLPRRL